MVPNGLLGIAWTVVYIVSFRFLRFYFCGLVLLLQSLALFDFLWFMECAWTFICSYWYFVILWYFSFYRNLFSMVIFSPLIGEYISVYINIQLHNVFTNIYRHFAMI